MSERADQALASAALTMTLARCRPANVIEHAAAGFVTIEVFNNRQRLHSGLNYCSPDEFEKMEVA